ncbi:galactosylceramide sulfotransferase [Octopus sinensis]|uniref:Galactosylceramide sulfotransferase n=1 Tax=Octopus sinensis TaxID=2607531 RepID=A0A6P7SLM7_9MOLL|nr:galactosylceramide sulfotransferase [Octopus sinensis]
MKQLSKHQRYLLTGMISTSVFLWFYLSDNQAKLETILGPKCAARTHVVFVKTHKTASSTVTNIIQRFGLKHHLSFVLPKYPENYLWFDSNAFIDRLLPHPNGTDKKFDLLCNHAIYNRFAITKLMHNNTAYITILRHPVNQFLSAFYFYRTVYKIPYLVRIPGPNPVEEYLKDPAKYEPVSNYASYTNNRMTIDLGIPRLVFDQPALLTGFINKIDEEFDFVMIMEYFAESLVLLKRLMCWRMEDIISMRMNIFDKDEVNMPLKAGMFNSIKKWAHADLELYEYFYRKFWRRINQMKQDFWREVEIFKEIQLKVENYCLNLNASQDLLLIDGSEWNDRFLVSNETCKLLNMKEVKFMNYLRTQQKIDVN